MPRMLKLREAAAETGLTYSCLRRWILSGEFTYYVRAGSRYLVNMDRLADFLNSPACGAPENTTKSHGASLTCTHRDDL